MISKIEARKHLRNHHCEAKFLHMLSLSFTNKKKSKNVPTMIPFNLYMRTTAD